MNQSKTKKRIKIFLSSTFRDMHAERDVIMQKVYPAITQMLADKRIEVQFIDLRWGINTQDIEEHERENRVLAECISEIRITRPFFIGLLGDRYGWIPPRKHWDRALDSMNKEERDFIAAETSDNRSVTELEILFGALYDSDYLRRSLFCFRDRAVYDEMDAAAKAVYVDQDAAAQGKLEALKEKICARFENSGHENNICEYTCGWDGKKLTDLDNLADFLINSIVKEVLLYESEDEEGHAEQRFEQLNREDVFRIAGEIHGFKGRLQLLDQFRSYLESSCTPLLITAHGGFGKTALLCKLYDLFANEAGFIPLIHFTEKNGNNSSAVTMLKKWLTDWRLGYNHFFSPDEEVSLDELLFHFRVATGKLENKKVVILIDNFNLLTEISRLCNGKWVPQGVSFMASADLSWPLIGLKKVPMDYLRIPSISEQTAEEIITEQLAALGKSLPEAVMQALLAKTHNGFRSSGCVLWNKLMVRKLTMLDSSDFVEIQNRPGDNEALKIQEYLLTLVEESHPYPEPLFLSMLEEGARHQNFDLMYRYLLYIAASAGGLCESNLRELFGDQWDNLIFSSIRRWLDDFLITNQDTGIIDFRYEGYRDILMADKQSKTGFSKQLLGYFTHLERVPKEDPVFCYTLPAVLIELGLADNAEYLLHDVESLLARQTIRLLRDKLLKDTEWAEKWIENALKQAQTGTLRAVIRLVDDLCNMELDIEALELIVFAFGFIDRERLTPDSYHLMWKLQYLFARIHYQNKIPDKAEEMNLFVEDELSHFKVAYPDRALNDPAYIELAVENLLLKARLEAAQGMLSHTVISAMEYAFKKLNSLFFGQKESCYFELTAQLYAQLLSGYEETDQEQATGFKQQFDTLFEGERWMFDYCFELPERIRKAGIALYTNNNMTSEFLYNSGYVLLWNLHTMVPDNRFFIKMLFNATISKLFLTDDYSQNGNMTAFLDMMRDDVDYYLQEILQIQLYQQKSVAHLQKEYTKEKQMAGYIIKTHEKQILESGNPAMKQCYCLLKESPAEAIKTCFGAATPEELLAATDFCVLNLHEPAYAQQILELITPPDDDAENEHDRLHIALLKAVCRLQNKALEEALQLLSPIADAIFTKKQIHSEIEADLMNLYSAIALQLPTSGYEAIQKNEFVFMLLLNGVYRQTASQLSLNRAFYSVCMCSELIIPQLVRGGYFELAAENSSFLKKAIQEMTSLKFNESLLFYSLCKGYLTLSVYYEYIGKYDEMLYYMKQAESSALELVLKYPHNMDLLREYATIRDEKGRIYLTLLNASDKALGCFKEANSLFISLHKHSGCLLSFDDLMTNHHHLMNALNHQKQFEEAAKIGEEAIEAMKHKAGYDNLRLQAIICDALSDQYKAMKEKDKELTALLEARTVFEQMLESNPDDELYIRDYIQSGLRLTDYYLYHGKTYDETKTLIFELYERVNRALQTNPASIKLKELHLEILSRLSVIYFWAGEMTNGQQELQQFIDIATQSIFELKQYAIINLLYRGLNRNFDLFITLGMAEAAQKLLAVELKLKKDLIQQKILKEEDAGLDSIVKKLEIIEQLNHPQ